MQNKQAQRLRIAFALGAITDALALLPMLSPSLAQFLWGFADLSHPYQFAMGYGASLMFGWTVLLVWAYQKPLERQFVAVLTILVIGGLVAAELNAVLAGSIPLARMAPTWGLQAVLLILFASSYHYPHLQRGLAQ